VTHMPMDTYFFENALFLINLFHDDLTMCHQCGTRSNRGQLWRQEDTHHP
jgi:hypothetical protein